MAVSILERPERVLARPLSVMRRLNHDGRLRETPVVKPRPVQTREPAENLAVCGALNARTRLKFCSLRNACLRVSVTHVTEILLRHWRILMDHIGERSVVVPIAW